MPLAGVDITSTSPPWATTIWCVMNSPRPSPWGSFAGTAGRAKGIEDVRQQVGRDGAFVVHVDDDGRRVASLDAHLHAARRQAVLHGVAHEVRDDLGETIGVPLAAVVTVPLDGHLPLGVGGLQLADDLLADLDESCGLLVEREPAAGTHSREVEELIDHAAPFGARCA